MHVELAKAEDWRSLTFKSSSLPCFLVYGTSIYQSVLGYKPGSHFLVLIYSPHLIHFQILSTLAHHFLVKHYLPLDTFHSALSSLPACFQLDYGGLPLIPWPTFLYFFILFFTSTALPIPFVWFLVVLSNLYLTFLKFYSLCSSSAELFIVPQKHSAISYLLLLHIWLLPKMTFSP